jgi:hypothetical protein
MSAPIPLNPREIQITRTGLLSKPDVATPYHDDAMERRR